MTLVLIGLVLALLGAEYVTRRIVGPLRKVSYVLGRVADGDLSEQAPAAGGRVPGQQGRTEGSLALDDAKFDRF